MHVYPPAWSKGVNDPVLLMTPESWAPMVLGTVQTL